MPVATQIGGMLGNDHQVADARLDPRFAARAQVPLAGGIGLNDGDDLYPERAAHATSPTTTSTVITTIKMSAVLRSCSRNGLKPMSGDGRWALGLPDVRHQ